MTHVPYKGATQAAVGLAGHEVDAAFQGIATVNALVKGGKLRLVAVSTPRRLPQFPDVPTVGESGLPGFEFNSWFAMVAPAGTPKGIVDKLNDEIRKAVQDPTTRDKLIAIGVTPKATTAAEFGAATKVQFERYKKLIQEKGIRAE